ncbi:MAG TPA: GTPase ObgE [Candidatus Portnoybacteria bacterium]|nr:GTPase ObgE [Candidatus Portnoybacteria bacterium]
MFCDELKIKVVAGDGGKGAVSFRKEKYVPKGGPDGGDGGGGGNIILRANTNLNTLSHLTNGKVYKAECGGAGRKKNMTGKTAEDYIIEVPVGTIISNADKSEILADLQKIGEQVQIAKGGKGGMGNAHFVSSVHQAPKFAEYGEPGEIREITLELKMVADVGLIGLPSVGKSTLISVISNAKPKIAEYHFTTLVPNLGVVNMYKFGGNANDSFVVADIPGLIEGASEGKGLGHQFLKHITRTKLLVHIIDPLFGDTEKNYKTINLELKKFSKELAKREQIVVLNKIDLLNEKDLEEKIKEIKKVSKKTKIFPISGATHEGLQPLLFEMTKKLKKIKLKEKTSPSEKTEMHVLKPHLEKVRFEIEKIIKKKDHKIYRIVGKRIEQLIVMTDMSNIEGVERIYHYLEKLGIKKAIEKAGATFGDILRIKGKDIPYRK